MKLFKCQNCGQLLYFENVICEHCGHGLGFHAEATDLVTLLKIGDTVYQDVVNQKNHYRYCDNARYDACNWLIPLDSPEIYCAACKLNHTIPDISQPDYAVRWRKLETAKHRLVYTLLRLKLPAASKDEQPVSGLAFDFLADTDPLKKVVMGHDEGLITINLSEADEETRIHNRETLGEPYRTLLGHFRHESGHYYWDRLIAQEQNNLDNFRKLFGDERLDYTEALKKYYKTGAPANWVNNFVSAYSSAHPWEDWAETWAHYLHVLDTIETAYSFGMRVKPVAVSKIKMLAAEYNSDPFEIKDFQEIIDLWFPMTVAVNSLNRSMGQQDFYPFVISPPVIDKMKFIHDLIRPLRESKKSWF